MNTKTKNYFIASIFSMLIFIGGCSALQNEAGVNDASDTEPPANGSFIMRAQTNGVTETTPASNGIQQAIVSNSEIEKTYGIGDLKASRTISFLIGNSGTNAINNITITSSSNYLSFTPSTFQVLEGADSANFELFEIGVEHGVAINGIGYVDILPMGANSPTFTVTGTRESGETISSTYQLTFNAKVAAFELIVGGTTKDISVGDSNGTSPYGNLNNAKYFYSNNQSIEIRNIGNVDLNVRLLGHFDNINSLYSTYTIPQSQTVTINTPLTPYNQWVEVGGSNTVFNFDLYDVGTNGRAYLELLDAASP